MAKQDTRSATTDEEIDAAIARSNAERVLFAAGYDAASDAVTVRFTDGITASFPRGSLQGLEDATVAQLAEVQLEAPMGLYWPSLDVAHDVPGLLGGIFGTRRWLAENGRRGGSAKTAAKASAAKKNGAKGGRPATARNVIVDAFTSAKPDVDVRTVSEKITLGRRVTTRKGELFYEPKETTDVGLVRIVERVPDAAEEETCT